MPLEIERKFLLRNDSWRRAVIRSVPLAQGYLSVDPLRTVRVRVAGDRAWLTVKGPVVGITRAEFEYPVPVTEATAMLALCPQPVVEKTRHYVPVGAHVWEIDVFTGANAGLVLAEVELAAPDENITLPGWVGEEVSGQARYYNSSLLRLPYCDW